MPSRSQLESTAGDLYVAARLIARWRPYVRNPITLPEAHAALAQRLQRRDPTFLALVRDCVFGRRANPYRQLFQVAGCHYADLEHLVGQRGIEGALQVLHRAGVYLTVDEFKGRRPAVRGGVPIEVQPDWLRNPRAPAQLPAQTGGSRGQATRLGFNFDFLRETGGNHLLGLEARGGVDWTLAVWTVPGGAALAIMGPFLAGGFRFARWFSMVNAATPGLQARYQWSGRVFRWATLLGGVRLPHPAFAPLEQPLAVAHWMASVLREGGVPHLFSSTSAAVRLCQAAVQAGIDVRGARFTVGGEPVTADRLAEIERAGAHAVPRYAATDYGTLGYACCTPEAPDDVHVPHDRVAIVQPGDDATVSGLPPTDLLITSLSQWSSVVLINVSLGDQGALAVRACGCPLGKLGWSTHLQTIRSYEKLTAGGMTFLDTDVVRALEQVLPGRFGGNPTHYQLVDDVGTDGQPRLWLLVHPAIGPLDPEEVVDEFLTGVGYGSGTDRIMSQVWRAGGFLQVLREPPRASDTGKILHLHTVLRPGAPGPAP